MLASPAAYVDIIPDFMPFRFQQRLPYLLVAAATLALDRWTKALIQKRFGLNESISVIDGFFNITYVRNTGVAFGIFDPLSLPAKSVLLSAFTAFAVVVVITYSVRSPLRNRLLQIALALILGGAVGNLYDRLAYGYVVDFLEFYAGAYHWPSFNIADSAISIGVVLLALEILRDEAPSRT
jgi:signal peptidase II